MIIRCAFEQVPELCAGLVKQGVTFTCYESSDGLWLITLMGGTNALPMYHGNCRRQTSASTRH